MSDLTLGLIYEIKQSSEWRDAVIRFMMKYSGSPRSSYTDLVIYRIMKTAFLDYLNTADKPAITVDDYLMSTERFPMLSADYHMAVALINTRVRDDFGNYINGFRPLPDEF